MKPKHSDTASAAQVMNSIVLFIVILPLVHGRDENINDPKPETNKSQGY